MSVPTAPAVLLAAALLGCVCLLLRRLRRPAPRWTPAGYLASIHVYPLKSGAGTACQRAHVTRLGVRTDSGVLDRCLAVVCQGEVLSASSRRRLVLIAADVSGRDVTLSAAGRVPLTVTLPRPGDGGVSLVQVMLNGHPDSGAELGPAAAHWLAEFFDDGKRYSMIYFVPELVQPRRTRDLPRPYVHLSDPKDVVSYNFVSPVSLLTSASLDELNARLETPVSVGNFRHNLIVGGAAAFDDDTWSYVRIGAATLRHVKPVQRCAITTVDPQTGERSQQMEPLRTLRTFRLPKTTEEKRLYKEAPLFGTCLGVDVEGELAVGDVVYVMKK